MISLRQLRPAKLILAFVLVITIPMIALSGIVYKITTDSFYENQESDTNSTRTVQQSSQITDGSLVYTMMPRSAPVQPYLKGGAAFIKKNQTIKYLNAAALSIPESVGWAPSYGAGLKIVLTEKFSIKLSYDVWQTPLSDGSKSDDTSFKAGLSWYL